MIKWLCGIFFLIVTYSNGEYLNVIPFQGSTSTFSIQNISKITFKNDSMTIYEVNKSFPIPGIRKIDFNEKPTYSMPNTKKSVNISPKAFVRTSKDIVLVDIPSGYRNNPVISILNIQGKIIHRIRNSGELTTVKLNHLPSGIYIMEIRSLNKRIHSNFAISK